MPGFKNTKIVTSIQDNLAFNSQEQIIRSVLQNLVENAIKYQREGVDTNLIMISVQEAPEGILINVSDNGQGISGMNLNKIFSPSFSGSQKSEGYGMGLYFVKKNVIAAGGQIDVTSKLGEGTTFSIMLPSFSTFSSQQTG